MTSIENCIDGENPLYDWCMDHYNDNNQYINLSTGNPTYNMNSDGGINEFSFSRTIRGCFFW